LTVQIDAIDDPDDVANHTDTGSQNGAAAENSPKPIAPWLLATAADLENVDFEAPIAGLLSAERYELSEAYRRAGPTAGEKAEGLETAEGRIFVMLSAVTGMHLKAHERDEPFGPMLAWADGRRSAIPADFREGHIDLLADLAIRAANPVLRARLADVAWLLDRKRGKLGGIAITAYVDTIEAIEAGTLKFPYGDNNDALEHGGRDMLCRALHIGRTIGWEKSEALRAQGAVLRLRERATARGNGVAALWFAELDLDFGVSDPAAVAAGIEGMLRAAGNANVHILSSLWRLAARGYHLAKRDTDKYRCQTEAAEVMVAEAEHIFAGEGAKQASAMLASHMMSGAIAQLHGVPAAKERRIALRHRLVDMQAGIPDEMSVYSHQWDVKDIAAGIKDALGDRPLFDHLFLFALLSTSPDPAALIAEAEQSIRAHPLSTLFAAVYYDREGKAVHRSEPGGFGEGNGSAVRRRFAEAEAIRRNLLVVQIEVARQEIMTQHFLPEEETLATLFQHSPFVPPELIATFSRGFLRFFQGDFASAVYILTPLVESSLRYVLKQRGHDVTTFDDATQTQKSLTISQLFEQRREELDAVFTKPITTDIENIFLNQPGPHLRHDIAHGLAHDGTPYGPDAVYGCWLIFQLCLAPLFPYRDQLRELIH
jgi:hypothetical protein